MLCSELIIGAHIWKQGDGEEAIVESHWNVMVAQTRAAAMTLGATEAPFGGSITRTYDWIQDGHRQQ